MKVEFYFTPPVEATKEQIEEWIEFCLCERFDMRNDNPLVDCDIDLSAQEGHGLKLTYN